MSDLSSSQSEKQTLPGRMEEIVLQKIHTEQKAGGISKHRL